MHSNTVLKSTRAGEKCMGELANIGLRSTKEQGEYMAEV
jgi:hypothetical protein